MTIAPTLLIELTRDEVILLTDRTGNDECGTQYKPFDGYQLLLRLGALYLELVDPDGSPGAKGQMAVTENEAWHLRSRVTSGDKLATDPLFGVKLLRKIYRVLLDFNNHMDLPTADGDGQEMDHDGLQKALVSFREAEEQRDKASDSEEAGAA